MFSLKGKKSHPAAAGRFASYGEIVNNFSVRIAGGEINDKDKTGGRIASKNIPRVIALYLLSLITAIILTLFLNAVYGFSKKPVAGFTLTTEYILFSVLIFFILYFISGNPSSVNAKIKNLSKEEKSFDIGILRTSADKSGTDGKKYPDVVIGLDGKKRYEHMLIVSPTGGGKTSNYIIPGIISDASSSGISVFAVDIDSPYLYEAVKKDWKNAGKKVVLFDPYGEYCGNSVNFNPLTDKNGRPLSDDKLLNIAAMLFQTDKNEIKGGDVHAHKYYSRRSSDLFYAVLIYLKYRYGGNYFDLFTVKSFFERGVKFIENETVKFNGENEKKIRNLFNNFLELPLYERAKVVTDVLNNLDFLNDTNVGKYFKCKSRINDSNSNKGNNIDNDKESECFNPEEFFTEDTLFIAGIPKEKINSGGGRLISFITQIFINGIYEYRRSGLRSASGADNAENSAETKEDGRSFFIYLDEFPVLTLNDFDTELANLRKTNTGVCMTVQDIAFLKERYGDTALITSNIGTQIVMGHAGWETCKYYSEMSGERYVLHKEFLRKHINDLDFGESPVASGLYPLISPDELKNMDRNSVFVYTKYVNPFILSLR
ncbi:MAG: type IV secretory system conjugative DNA transfer family protein [Candidatus Acidulodesulfobacterium sp.]